MVAECTVKQGIQKFVANAVGIASGVGAWIGQIGRARVVKSV